MTQQRLFTEQIHLEPDCWLSGTPDEPDPIAHDYLYWNGLERPKIAESDIGAVALGREVKREPTGYDDYLARSEEQGA